MVPSSATPSIDDALAGLQNALPVQRIDADGFAAEQRCEGAAGNQRHLVAVGENDLVVGMNLAVLQPRHAVIHPSGYFADFGMQRAAEGDVHLLQAPANAEQRHAAGDAGLGQRQRQVVARDIVRLVLRVRFGAEAGRMHIGAGAGQHHAVDHVQQRADIGDLGRRGKHQRQRAGDVGHGAKVALPDHLHGEAVFDAMRVSDHADHRSSHRIASCSFPRPGAWIMPGSGRRIKLTAL